MHLISITALNFHFGPIIHDGKVKFSAEGWELTVEEFINNKTGPKIVEVPEVMQVEHDTSHTVRFGGVLRSQVTKMGKQTFKEVVFFSQRKASCAACGKPATRRLRYFQTINPFNKNTDGSVKTAEQILVELKAEAAEAKLTPLYHARCEGKSNV